MSDFVSGLSKSCGDCLKVIAGLSANGDLPHSSKIAEQLGVPRSAVCRTLKKLADRGLIFYTPHNPAELTMSGKLAAEQLGRNRRIILDFLNRILNTDFDKARILSCEMEHILDNETVCKLEILSEALIRRNDCSDLRKILSKKLKVSQNNVPVR
ncbi:MAG: metal-dependent transcriptional regulator [Lentisphaeria bacterium]|nr:metal-dependent transcriptional regulator [Lentisphaeria bacterium]